MRELPRDPERLKHIILAIDNATSFTEGKSVEDLQKDPLLFFCNGEKCGNYRRSLLYDFHGF